MYHSLNFYLFSNILNFVKIDNCIFFAVGMFKRPDPENVTEDDLQVDIVKAWDDLDKSQIAEGLVTGKTIT